MIKDVTLFLVNLKIKLLIDFVVNGSNPVVGSSKNRILGLLTIALAKATLFCIPHDNSEGIFCNMSSSNSTSLSIFFAIDKQFTVE